MEVTKMDVPSQLSATQDSAAPAESNTSTDLSFDFILQTTSDSDPTIKKTDKLTDKLSNKLNNKINEESDDPSSSDNFAVSNIINNIVNTDNNVVLAQLNMLNNTSTPIDKNSNLSEKTPDATIDSQSKPAVTPASSIASSIAQQTTAVSQLNSKNMNDTASSAPVATPDIKTDPISTLQTNPTIPTISKKIDNQLNKVETKSDVKLDAKEESINLGKINDSVQQMIDSTSVASKESIDKSINKSNIQNVPDKVIDAFTQLGNLINNQTAPQLAHPLQRVVSDFSVTQANYSLKMRDAEPGINETKIELSTPSISSVMKEGYDAKIKIYPPELGHVIAKLRVDKNSTDLVILTENSHVKGIVESNLPKLREHFQQAGINLTDIQVHTSLSDAKEQNSQQEGQRHHESYSLKEYTNEINNKQTIAPEEEKKSPNTIIDTYA